MTKVATVFCVAVSMLSGCTIADISESAIEAEQIEAEARAARAAAETEFNAAFSETIKRVETEFSAAEEGSRKAALEKIVATSLSPTERIAAQESLNRLTSQVAATEGITHAAGCTSHDLQCASDTAAERANVAMVRVVAARRLAFRILSTAEDKADLAKDFAYDFIDIGGGYAHHGADVLSRAVDVFEYAFAAYKRIDAATERAQTAYTTTVLSQSCITLINIAERDMEKSGRTIEKEATEYDSALLGALEGVCALTLHNLTASVASGRYGVYSDVIAERAARDAERAARDAYVAVVTIR